MEEDEDKLRQKFEDYSFLKVDELFKKFEGKLELMPVPDQEIVRIWRLEADMYNGGFIQYFCNWGFHNFEETQKVLNKISATKSMEIITEGEKIISVLKDDERIKELWDIPKYLGEYLSKEEEERLNQLDLEMN